MKQTRLAGILGITLIFTGCAAGLTPVQEHEYRNMKSKNVLIEEKNPTTGVMLGFLPGGGSFYAREPLYGVLNLLAWPLSILWDTSSGYRGAQSINYSLTKHALKKNEEQEMSKLDDRLSTGEITSSDYVLEKNRIKAKYSFD